jgi:hypothetical protein
VPVLKPPIYFGKESKEKIKDLIQGTDKIANKAYKSLTLSRDKFSGRLQRKASGLNPLKAVAMVTSIALAGSIRPITSSKDLRSLRNR